ncbi:unnamed protein product [Symbiodinium natans]|uniref:RING-type domain-containing protein n=1 Tax=Symbiodinium natans TaxID=878477 RepID=A0A812USN1_9DINO|nr:unnamed protein product [Symbiodinium natans]
MKAGGVRTNTWFLPTSACLSAVSVLAHRRDRSQQSIAIERGGILDPQTTPGNPSHWAQVTTGVCLRAHVGVVDCCHTHVLAPCRQQDDHRIWQSALLTSELKSAVDPLFKRRARWALPLAEKEVQDAFRKATKGTDGEAESEDSGKCRKPIEGEDCAVCFEAMRMSEEAAGQLVCCGFCGNNFHSDCIRRWQLASSGKAAQQPCPLCRQPWQPAMHVPPGGRILTSRLRPCAGSAYLNLSLPSTHR